MLNECIVRSVLSAETRYIDGSYISLDFIANIKNENELNYVVDWLYSNFIESMSGEYVMLKTVDGPTSQRNERFREAFLEGCQHNRWCEYIADAYKKDNRFTSLKKIEKYQEYLHENSSSVGKTTWRNCIKEACSELEGYNLMSYLFDVKPEIVMETEQMHDAHVSITYRRSEKALITCEIEIGLAAYSLKSVDKAATWLASTFSELMERVEILRGSLFRENDFFAKYGTDEWSLFEYELSSLSETLWDYRESNYISSFEWLTILPPGVISDELLKIVDADEYAKIKRIGSNYVVTAGNPISKHKRKFYKGLYENLEDYMLPGFSKVSIYDLRPNFEDLWVPENQYAIQGETVYFLRGNFDYIKDVDQSDYWYGIYLECCDAIKKKVNN